MGSESKGNYGAEGRSDLLKFDPEVLIIVEDEKDSPLYDERAFAPPPEWMIVSMMEEGNIEPIQARRNGQHKDGTFRVEVVNGRNRTRAAREANKRLKAMGSDKRVLIRAELGRGTDIEHLKRLIAANEGRIEDTPMNRARKLKRLLDLGCPLKECEHVFMKKESTLRNWVKLLECADVVQRAVDRGEASASVVQELHTLSHAEQKVALEAMLANGTAKGSAGREAVERAKQGQPVGDGEDRVRMRSRGFLEKYSAELRKAGETSSAALVDFILGKETALLRQAELRTAAEAAGWKRKEKEA